MAVKVTFDTVNKLIICNAGVTTLDVRVDVYSDMKEDWESGALDIGAVRLNKFKFPIRSIGGDDTAPGEIAPLYSYLKYGWRIRPQEASHVLNMINGAILVDGDTTIDPFVNTLGAFTVRVRLYVPIKGTLMATGSGVTEQDKVDIISGVWNEVRLGTFTMADMMTIIQRMTYNKVTMVGDIATIYEEDGITIWKTFDLANDGRVEQ